MIKCVYGNSKAFHDVLKNVRKQQSPSTTCEQICCISNFRRQQNLVQKMAVHVKTRNKTCKIEIKISVNMLNDVRKLRVSTATCK